MLSLGLCLGGAKKIKTQELVEATVRKSSIQTNRQSSMKQPFKSSTSRLPPDKDLSVVGGAARSLFVDASWRQGRGGVDGTATRVSFASSLTKLYVIDKPNLINLWLQQPVNGCA